MIITYFDLITLCYYIKSIFKFEEISPVDLLTALVAPFLLWLVGFLFGSRHERKREKEKIQEQKQTAEIIKSWLIIIRERLLLQADNIQPVIDMYDKNPFIMDFDQEFVIIPTERLLNFPDSELRMVLQNHYINIITDIIFAKECQTYLKEDVYKKWSNKSMELSAKNTELNKEGYELFYSLTFRNSNFPQVSEKLGIEWYLNSDPIRRDVIIKLRYSEFIQFLNTVEFQINSVASEKIINSYKPLKDFFLFKEKYKEATEENQRQINNYKRAVISVQEQFRNMAAKIQKFLDEN